MTENHSPPKDESPEWLEYPDVPEQPIDDLWQFKYVAEPSYRSPIIREQLQNILKEMRKNAIPVLGELIQGIAEAVIPGRFHFWLTVLSLILVFRFTYPLFFTDTPNAFWLMNSNITFLPWPTTLVNLQGEYSSDAGLSNTVLEKLDEFTFHLGSDNYEDLDVEKAEQAIDSAISGRPDTPFLYLLRAEFSRTYLADCKRALSDYTTAVQLDNSLSTAFLGRGYCYLRNNQILLAVRDLNMSIQIDQDPRAYILRGMVYEHFGLYHGAIDDYTAAIEQNEHSTILDDDWCATLFFRRGYVHRETKQWDKCVADFSKSMEVSWFMKYLGVAGPGTYANRGYCLTELGRYEEALTDYSDLLENWGDGLDKEYFQWIEQQIDRLELTIEEQDQK
jgi:tetratricopeptide (TPR) repeat protein